MKLYINFAIDRLIKKKDISHPLFIFAFFLLFGIILSCGKHQGGEFKSNTNSPPVIISVNILPEAPHRDSELSVFVRSQDPNGDSIMYHYQWVKNEDEMTGEDKSVLKEGNFKKGDFIQVRVIPSDGKENGKPFLSDPVKIINSAPVIQEVWIEPKEAYVTDRLKANVKSSDPDEDDIYYTYQWEKNGVVLSEEGGEILEQGQFKKGDSITLTAIPDDKEILGKSKRSNPLTILNSSPLIFSSPATSAEKDNYIYQVKAHDPDDDPIIISLKSGPPKMELKKNNGLIRWEICKEDKGLHLIEIEASDNAGARSFQRFTLKVEYK